MATSDHVEERGRARLAKEMDQVREIARTGADDEILRHLHDVRREYLARLDGVSDAQANFSPGEGEWSISQVTRHMIHSNKGIAKLVRVLASGHSLDGKPVPGIVPDSAGNLEADRKVFEESMDRLDAAMEALQNNPDLTTRFTHQWFGDMNAREWLVFSIAHQRLHIAQIDRIKRAGAYPES